ncbi:MAG: hypothetical protein UX38_C0002G0119 [Microgenomates group bacterium GW2011_GWC1_46_16]|uniref:Pilus assembly protein PilO n=2 Tax=Candidatus Collieribacteriota TaxID=1752725 RepID=A0A1F5FYA8_9BACT|nr:MAG: hypothetical protein UX32_C0001G0002 [Microgenomates group bacterium GW2011_GWF1_46_12]KKU26939.1 MAG: hypothetical protein UX38_C0002G0119 [Microgenomates group bacterium GW2011_GWC1_46_16]KKU28356.1 MAG: hypothetical protein UX40_C0001G0119 [Microgenomates group bacterium GW2011_GWF2_46_18]KKU44022.1 MAG: hypothetical protein UX59_C0005G0014 [Microgenomates group bacterium GW2011_GWA1_46_7]KKU45184.1 MAG: hypothetical protein UX63_C0010G0013 [Microgenomates group bacterium GW2011_GWB1
MAWQAKVYNLDLKRYYRTPATQMSLAVVLSLFVSGFFLVFALRPTVVAITKLNKTIEEGELTLTKLEAKVNSLEATAEIYEEIKFALPVLERGIPQIGVEYGTLAQAVEYVAYQTGVEIGSENMGEALIYSRLINPYTLSKNQNIIKLPFSVRVAGDYGEIKNFLSRFMRLGRVVNVETISISNETGREGEGVTSANISGEAYYLANEAQLTKLFDLKETKR